MTGDKTRDAAKQGGSAPLSALHRANLSQLGENDIVVASYGGAGQSMIANVLQELGLNFADPYTETLQADGRSSAVTAHDDFRRRFPATWARDRGGHALPRSPWPRFVKTHLSAELLADRPLGGVWLHVRDPRDALRSWFHWRQRFAEEVWDQIHGSFEDFLAGPDYSGRRPPQDWAAFYAGWRDRARSCRVSTLTRFEDLKADARGTLHKALLGLGVEVMADELAHAVTASSFGVMRAHEEAVVGCGPMAEGDRIMRRGVVDEWKEWLTPDLARLFAGCADVASQFGYRLDVDDTDGSDGSPARR